MDPKKIDNENTEAVSSSTNEREVKISAVDTGRRVAVGNLANRPNFIRRRPVRTRVDDASVMPSPQDNPPEIKTTDEKENKTIASEKKAHDNPIANLETEVPAKVEQTAKPEEKKIPLYVEPLEIDDSGDFASLLEENDEPAPQIALKVGDKVTGKVVHIGRDNIFLSLGPKIEAAIATSELSDTDGNVKVRLGQKVTSYIISIFGGVVLSNNVAQSGVDSYMLEEARANKVPVEGKVTGVNKGGFDVLISGKRAFCPVGQIDSKFVEDTNAFVGRTLSFLIERIEEGGRNIVLSRRVLLERERRDKALEIIKNLEVGKKFDAVITRVADFGAFADIGGLEGLIPRSEVSYGHVERISDVISSGDRVQVIVLSLDINQADVLKSKLSFSLKKSKEDPYTLHWHKIKSGTTLEGRVVRLETFGAFVELFPGIDGLIHISELSENRVAHPKEILSVGDPVTVRVVSVDDEERRIGLSLRESVIKKKDLSLKESIKVERGQKASGIVSRIERYGVFLELDNGAVALLPQSEIGLARNTDLSRAFKLGDRVDVLIIDVDAQNRVRVSILARKQLDERDSYLEFHEDNERKNTFGTFADLLKKKK